MSVNCPYATAIKYDNVIKNAFNKHFSRRDVKMKLETGNSAVAESIITQLNGSCSDWWKKRPNIDSNDVWNGSWRGKKDAFSDKEEKKENWSILMLEPSWRHGDWCPEHAWFKEGTVFQRADWKWIHNTRRWWINRCQWKLFYPITMTFEYWLPAYRQTKWV